MGTRAGKRFAGALMADTLEGRTTYREALQLLGMKKIETFNQFARELKGREDGPQEAGAGLPALSSTGRDAKNHGGSFPRPGAGKAKDRRAGAGDGSHQWH